MLGSASSEQLVIEMRRRMKQFDLFVLRTRYVEQPQAPTWPGAIGTLVPVPQSQSESVTKARKREGTLLGPSYLTLTNRSTYASYMGTLQALS